MRWLSRIVEIVAAALGSVLGAIAGTVAAWQSNDAGSVRNSGTALRTSWLVDDEISPESAVRPIQAMLRWLRSREGLTEEGERTLKAIEADGETDVSLTQDLVKPEYWDFVADSFKEWWETFGIKLAADESEPLGDGAEIDALWSEYQARAKVPGKTPRES